MSCLGLFFSTNVILHFKNLVDCVFDAWIDCDITFQLSRFRFQHRQFRIKEDSCLAFTISSFLNKICQ